MKFSRLSIHRYGHFDKREIELSDDRGLHILYGPNEAGKSTLHNAIRGLLFGIEARTRYNFLYSYQEMLLGAVLRDTRGRTLTLERKKGNKNTLTGRIAPGDHLVDDRTLEELLGGVNEDMYARVFGFTLQDLQSGADVLKLEGLREALLGGAMGGGGSRIGKLKGSLDQQAADLFAARASSRPINKLVGLIKEGLGSIRRDSLRPDDYLEHEKEQRRLTESLRTLREDRERADHQRRRLERLSQALEPFREVQSIDHELSAPHLAIPLDPPAVEAARTLLARLPQRRSEVRELEQDLARLHAQLEGLEVREDLLAQAGLIQRLYGERQTLRTLREGLPGRTTQLKLDQTDLERRLKLIGPDWTFERLEGWTPDLTSRLELRELTARIEENEAAINTYRTTVKERDGRLVDLERDLQALGASSTSSDLPHSPQHSEGAGPASSDPDTLATLALELEEQATRLRDLDGLTATLDRLDGLIARARLDLTPPCPAGVLAEQLAVPSREALEAHREELERLEAEQKAAHEQSRKAGGELRDAQLELEHLGGGDDVPTLGMLRVLRERRQTGWGLVRRAWLEGVKADEEIQAFHLELPLDRAYEAAVEDADAYADRMRERADLVARKAELAGRVARADAAAGRALERLQAADEGLARGQERWTSLWQTSGLEPASPRVMLDWLARRGVLSDRVEERRLSQARQEPLRQAAGHYELRLRAALADQTASQTTLLQRLRTLSQQAEQKAGARKQLERNLEDARLRLAQAREAEKLQVETAITLLETLQRLLPRLGLPSSLAPANARAILEGLEALEKESRALRRQALELDRDVLQVSAYDADLQALVTALAPELAEAPLDNRITDLWGRYETARANQSRRGTLLEQVQERTPRFQSRRAELDLDETRVAALMEQAGIEAGPEGEVALADQVQRADHRSSLESRRAGAIRQLDLLLGQGPERERAGLELAEVDPDELARRREEADRTWQDLEERQTAGVRQLAELETRMQAEARQTSATEEQARVEGLKAELQESVEQYAVYRLAHAILAAEVERFSRDHQPKLLEHVGRLMAAITGGRYLRVVQPLGREAVALEAADGSIREPEALSTGTLEQLFLAIRLAYALEYCSSAEPLPLIMDDVLVNFDEGRARSALLALNEVSGATQILFLTCHQHLVDLAREVIPGVSVHRV